MKFEFTCLRLFNVLLTMWFANSRYTYGKGLQGLAYIRFALVDGQGNRTYLPGLEMQNKVRELNESLNFM